MSEKRARVAIVEDDPILREELTRVLSLASDLELAGAADCLAAGRALILQPIEVLLIDLALPDGSGIDLIREARTRQALFKIIVISVFGDARSVVQAIEAGADGYLLKGADPVEAASAIRSVLDGGAPISPAVASHILARIRPQAQAGAPVLSEREIAVLTDLAKGFRYKEVARLQGISPNTVGDHVKSIYRKLAVNSRSEAVFEAVQAGLINLKD
ncbi:response regulator [Terricaulis sp.]|uniref:response regulator n=1 Tax=Terricaulis sp. TaxID=2768686 RepID=UPI0037849CE5